MIDFSSFDLGGLYSIYTSYLNLISDNEEFLKKEGLSELEYKICARNISDYQHCLTLVSIEISKKWDGKSSFSREYIFNLCSIHRKSIIFTLRAGSISFNKFGQTVVGWGSYDEAEKAELLSNLFQVPPVNTYGIIKIETLDHKLPDRDFLKPTFSKEQLELLITEGIDTRDIFEIAF